MLLHYSTSGKNRFATYWGGSHNGRFFEERRVSVGAGGGGRGGGGRRGGGAK